eukprot:scaffold154722_cov36-Cyclotella_meneghiniana.AAC.1
MILNVCTGKEKFTASKPLVIKYTMGLELNKGGGFVDHELREFCEYALTIVRGLALLLLEVSFHIWDKQLSDAFPNQDEMHQIN